MTLVELLVTLAVMAIVISGIAQALSAFQTIYTVQSYKRQANAAARQGVAVIERDLRAAGFGIEPALAFDFNIYQGDGQFCLGTVTGNLCAQPNATNARDRTTGTDQLVFYSREPNYWGGDAAGEPEGWAWQVNGAAGTQLNLRGHRFPQTLRKGQILQVVCVGATEQAYVTVNTTITSTGSDDANIPVAITPGVADDPFQQTTLVTAGGSCLGQTTARVFMVNRYRYYVEPQLVLPDNSRDTFLMLDTGLDQNGDNAVNAADNIPVARGVVDLQVGYLRPSAAGVAGATEEVGTTPTGALQACQLTVPGPPPAIPLSKITTSASCLNGLGILDFSSGAAARYAQYSYLPADIVDPARRSEDAGNISAVHVVMVARSEGAVRALAATRAPALMNRVPTSILADPPNRPFAYSVQETMIPVRNTIASSMLSYL
jgi:Tfp pilus assembly protein PilW